MAERYAAEYGLMLDRHLSFRDLGVRAFRGKTAKEGALHAFLEAIEHNPVPWGSCLLIESLDRLSRDRILAAQAVAGFDANKAPAHDTAWIARANLGGLW
jgi:hypothetical protein